MINEFKRKLIEVEISKGFLNIPKTGIDLMPDSSCKISVKFYDDIVELTYDAKNRRIYGLTKYYKKFNINKEDIIVINKNDKGEYILRAERNNLLDVFMTREGKSQLIDLSGLSSQAKGNIVEDRIKELLVLHGQGLLSIYKPVSDTEGIDLIIVKNGQFHPIFLQVKGRYNLHQNRSLILRVKVKTFNPHQNYFVVGVYFNPETLEINENILLIPSEDLVKKAAKVNSKNGEWYSVVSPLNEKYAGKWSQYLIKKDKLATILIEKFEEINKYVK